MSGVLGLLLAAGGAIAPVLVGSQTEQDSGGSLTITKPTGTVAGDFLVGLMANDGGSSWSGDTGWTERVDQGSGTGLRAATKLAGGSEASDYTFTASGEVAGAILAYRGGTFDVIGTIDSSIAGAAVDAPSVTLSADGLLLAFYAIDQPGRTFTTPSGMAPLASQNAREPSFAVFVQEVGAGATGIKSSTPSGGGNSAGILIGLRSA